MDMSLFSNNAPVVDLVVGAIVSVGIIYLCCVYFYLIKEFFTLINDMLVWFVTGPTEDRGWFEDGLTRRGSPPQKQPNP